ncbi:MAG: glutamine--tRNA ligase/YqeY domain fusion protein [Spirochaetales bacterium]
MKPLAATQTWKLETSNFITEIIDKDLAAGAKQIVTRFPPEPNGYLHIGHGKALVQNFGIAARYNGKCNLRFDDTNPAREEMEYVKGIIDDVKWLVGHDAFEVLWSSDYFQFIYDRAVDLVKRGLAYMDDDSSEEISKKRGAPTEKGTPSPYRNRSIDENLALFQAMTDGKFDEGACCLRAKIDMESPNLNLRDPILYRIKKAPHHNTGTKWCVYPMYDWAHGWEDSIEGVTHSLCSLEYDNHRPLYDWFLDQFPAYHHPRQYEFNRLNITHTVLSKRKLIQLVKEGRVSGWDDPRMPTLCGLRRRGYTPAALRRFIEAAGCSRTDGIIDLGMLEWFIRDELNKTSPRVMAVFNPIKVTLTNYSTATSADGKSELVQVENNPELPETGSRDVPFGPHLLIDGEDFAEAPAKGWFRLAPGAEVRLKGAYFITCQEVIKDAGGKVIELKCTYDPASRGGESPDGRKVKGTIQWVSADHGVELETRLYAPLLSVENAASIPDDEDWLTYVSPESQVVTTAWCEPGLAKAEPAVGYQFMRKGYFTLDTDSTTAKPVFNRIVTLKDTWKK